MPFFEGSLGKVYYRDWNVAEPTAVLVFSHGYGEHSGLFHRFAFAANRAGFRVLGIDAIGHGLSDGPRGKANVEALAKDIALLCDITASADPVVPTVLVGHSMGSIASVLALAQDPQRYISLVLTGSPILNFDASVLGALDDVVMSRDAFYLDQLDTDPLEAWLKDDDGPDGEMFSHEKEIWGALPELDVPILFVNGQEDPIAPPSMGRAAASKCRNARVIEVTRGCHDIINDAPHVEVTEHILTFVAASRLHLL